MAIDPSKLVDVGSAANDNSGDPLRTAFIKINTVVSELWDDDEGDVNSVSAGTGISVNQSTGAVTVTNSAPNYNHTGEVTGATELTIASGAVTNAKMAANSVDSDQYVDGSIDTVHLANDIVTYDKLAAEFTTAQAVSATTLNFDQAQVFTKTLAGGSTTFTVSGADVGMVKDLILTGTGSFLITGGKLIAGNFVESATNFVQIVAQTSSSFWYSISQEQA